MIITDELGIYVSDFGGVRTKDLILVTEEGYKVILEVTKGINLFIMIGINLPEKVII